MPLTGLDDDAMASLPSKFAGDRADVDTSAVSHHSSTTDATQNTSEGIENAPESENRGLKRKARDALVARGARVEEQERCMFVELPDDILAISLSFQAHKDRLSVAITCKDLLKKVETFSERKWKEIQLKGDETWETRLRDQSSINTDNPKPLVLPHRYLLWKAYRMYLYALGDPNASEVVGLEVIMPDKSLFLTETVSRHPVCQTWDLTTKQCVKNFDFFPGQQEQEEIYNVLNCGEHVIAEGYASVFVWTRDGELMHRIRVEDPDSFIIVFDSDEKRVFFGNESNSISCLHIGTGAVERGVVSLHGRLPDESLRMLVLSENLLLVLISGVGEAKEGSSVHSGVEVNGIYVFDIEGGYSQQHFYSGDYYSIIKASDDPSTIIALKEGHIDVFKLENGQLSLTTTFACSSSVHMLLAAQSRAYVRNDDNDRVEVYSTISGERLYLIGPLSGKATVAVTNGCELFLGYYSNRTGDRRGPPVRAYCLDGY